jgi:hypothetical protein
MVMADGRAALRQALRIGAVLALAAVTGYLLGGCGGGDLGGVTGLSGVTELPTGTRPSVTLPTLPTRTETVPGATGEAPSTAPEATTTRPTTTVIKTETSASETPPTTDTTATETVAPEPTSSETNAPWGWIALALGLVLAALIIGFVVWRRRRASSASWSSQLADLARRCLVAMDDVLREGSVVTGQVQALAAEARSLEGRAPDDRSRAAAARLRVRLEELARALEADRALRLSSPPPSEGQLSYSTALIRGQVTQLQDLLQPPSGDEAPT